MSVETWVVTPSIRLEGTKAIATQPSRVRVEGAVPAGPSLPSLPSVPSVPSLRAVRAAPWLPGAPDTAAEDVRPEDGRPATTPHAATRTAKAT